MTNFDSAKATADPEDSLAHAPLSKREKNKQNTRNTIALAALELAKTHGYEALTVDLVAAEADVSRRTFFNYFSSIDDCLTEWVRRILDRAIEEMDKQPLDIPVMESAIKAFGALTDDDSLRRVAELSRVGTKSQSLQAIGLSSWHDCAARVSDHLIEFRKDIAPFDAKIFSQVVIGGAMSAFQEWERTVASAPTPADLKRLEEFIHRALLLIKEGFPTFTNHPTRKDS